MIREKNSASSHDDKTKRTASVLREAKEPKVNARKTKAKPKSKHISPSDIYLKQESMRKL